MAKIKQLKDISGEAISPLTDEKSVYDAAGTRLDVKLNAAVYVNEEAVDTTPPPTVTADRAVADEDGNNIKETYATKSELPDVSDMLTKTEASSTYQPKGDYLTEIPAEYVTDEELNAKSYATTSQLDSKLDTETYNFDKTTFATKEELSEKANTSDLSNYLQVSTAESTYAKKADMATKTWVGEQGYLTEHQDISQLATKQEVTEGLAGKQDKGNYIEDVNTDGFYLRKKENWIEMPLDILETFYTYGIEYDITVSSPDVTRIGNMALHKSLPIHNKIKGCLLADDGTVNKYLDASDWTNETRDGSQGQVMIELPMYYRKFETDGNKRRIKLSEYPLPGYHQVKKKYISAYEATVERSTNKLCSVVNTDVDYRGGNNNAEWDGTYRSLLGLPATLISRIKFREFARNRNANTYNWNCMTYDIQKDIYWLFVTEFATLNSQKEINNELTIEGYHQGGLGAGATTLNGRKWYAYNNYNPIIPCGYTDKIGNNTGELEFNMPSEYDETIKTIKVNRYRGIENVFGHLWKITDGVNVRISPTIYNGGDDLSTVYICNMPANFNDTNYENYDYIGDEARKEGYVKSVIFGDNGEIIPNEIGGSSTSYFCDYHYTNSLPIETLRILLFGGDASFGAYAGFAYANSYYTPSTTGASFGSRLCFLPE